MDLRKQLIALVKSCQKQAGKGLRTQIQLGGSGDSGARGYLWFGYGYFDPKKVLWHDADGDPEEMTVAEGVDKFLAAYGLK